jgi:hypothetical protein
LKTVFGFRSLVFGKNLVIRLYLCVFGAWRENIISRKDAKAQRRQGAKAPRERRIYRLLLNKSFAKYRENFITGQEVPGLFPETPGPGFNPFSPQSGGV